jgi:hypothetical protein
MRMERMGDPEMFYRTVLIDCSRRRTGIRTSSE